MFTGLDRMARAGEIEVFRINPEVGKCYEHVEATRNDNTDWEHVRYFSTNEPRYVGEFVRAERQGYRNSSTYSCFFKIGRAENRVDYSYEGTCFIEVPCVADAIASKARNQALRNVYETKTHRSATPGMGSANLIRSFAGIYAPRGGIPRTRSKRGKRKNAKTRSRR
jgi:hypothetical protein